MDKMPSSVDLLHPLKKISCCQKDIAWLLLAAGEILNGNTVKKFYHRGNICHVQVPNFLKEDHLPLTLKQACRAAIRDQLYRVDPHCHFFNRVPLLGLPGILASYLLYDMNLDISDRNEGHKVIDDVLEITTKGMSSLTFAS